ncbi:very short patch repair endonuclease [Brevibacillus dissolubilis]|uniref:very short patch repair endonuclease n=1 Tax=Brevibacillus dissolubilis TaxID=1844116 RepID=UPI0011166504
MADVFTPEQRRKNMQAIRSISHLERRIAQELWNRGIRFRRNVKNMFGKPDIAIKKYKVVIFIDSCFWHACPKHCVIPKTNTDFWLQKFKRNQDRDAKVNEFYRSKDWNLLRIWEHEAKADLSGTVDRIAEWIGYIRNFRIKDEATRDDARYESAASMEEWENSVSIPLGQTLKIIDSLTTPISNETVAK